MISKLSEGGNVFKGPEKQSLTQRIATGDVEETILYIEKITGLDFTKEKHLDDKKPVKWLGTTGRKEDPDGTFEKNSSGDLDLSVDANEVDKKSFADKLIFRNRFMTRHTVMYGRSHNITYTHGLTKITEIASSAKCRANILR